MKSMYIYDLSLCTAGDSARPSCGIVCALIDSLNKRKVSFFHISREKGPLPISPDAHILPRTKFPPVS